MTNTEIILILDVKHRLATEEIASTQVDIKNKWPISVADACAALLVAVVVQLCSKMWCEKRPRAGERETTAPLSQIARVLFSLACMAWNFFPLNILSLWKHKFKGAIHRQLWDILLFEDGYVDTLTITSRFKRLWSLRYIYFVSHKIIIFSKFFSFPALC